jgi:uridine kinase
VAGQVSVHQIADRVVASQPRLAGTRLVCIDGPAGSGKTSLAAALARELAARVGDAVPVVHMDDLYEGWEQALDAVAERLRSQLLEPLSLGRPGGYRRYDWDAGCFAEWHVVPPAAVVVIEGVGSAPRGVDPYVSLLVWIEAPADLRLARGVARDGETLRPQWERWMVHEREHAERERTRQRAHLILDGST